MSMSTLATIAKDVLEQLLWLVLTLVIGISLLMVLSELVKVATRPGAKSPTNSTKLPLLLNQTSYVDVEDARLRQPETIELIRAAHSWGFDGVELSMDALINEYGHNGRQFKLQLEQLAHEIDISNLPSTFQLRLDVDLISHLTVDLDSDFKTSAAMDTITLLRVRSYWANEDYPTTVDNVGGLVIRVPTGDDAHPASRVHFPIPKELKNIAYISVKGTKPLRFGTRENGIIPMGSHELQTAFKRLKGMQ